MIPVKAPRFDTNDDKVKMVQWIVQDGAKVEPGAAVATLETSKATFDLVIEHGGFFRREALAGHEYVCGDVLARIFETREEMAAFRPMVAADAAVPDLSGIVMSNNARKLALEKGVTDEQIRGLGKQVVREADILALVSRPGVLAASPGVALTKNQLLVARNVARAHREIPAAFLAMRVYCDKLLDGIAALRTREGVMAGIPEAMVCALGRLHGEYPSFYGSYADEAFTPAREPCAVGVTFDAGHGLFLPSMPMAGRKSLKEVAQWFALNRIKALRNNFKQEDLHPGDIAVSVNTEKDVESVVPFIFPPQVAIVSMGSVFYEGTSAAAGQVPEFRRYFLLGLAYDHRVNNGAAAARFASAIKRLMEEGLAQEIGVNHGG